MWLDSQGQQVSHIRAAECTAAWIVRVTQVERLLDGLLCVQDYGELLDMARELEYLGTGVRRLG